MRPFASKCQRAITLLEVILAMAILAGAMVLVGELTRLGARHAVAATDLSRGQLHCQSIFSMLESGLLPVTPVNRMGLELDPNWVYSVEVQSQTIPGLLAVRVSVQPSVEPEDSIATAQMTRWILDPVYVQQIVDQAAAEAAEEDESVL